MADFGLKVHLENRVLLGQCAAARPRFLVPIKELDCDSLRADGVIGLLRLRARLGDENGDGRYSVSVTGQIASADREQGKEEGSYLVAIELKKPGWRWPEVWRSALGEAGYDTVLAPSDSLLAQSDALRCAHGKMVANVSVCGILKKVLPRAFLPLIPCGSDSQVTVHLQAEMQVECVVPPEGPLKQYRTLSIEPQLEEQEEKLEGKNLLAQACVLLQTSLVVPGSSCSQIRSDAFAAVFARLAESQESRLVALAKMLHPPLLEKGYKNSKGIFIPFLDAKRRKNEHAVRAFVRCVDDGAAENPVDIILQTLLESVKAEKVNDFLVRWEDIQPRSPRSGGKFVGKSYRFYYSQTAMDIASAYLKGFSCKRAIHQKIGRLEGVVYNIEKEVESLWEAVGLILELFDDVYRQMDEVKRYIGLGSSQASPALHKLRQQVERKLSISPELGKKKPRITDDEQMQVVSPAELRARCAASAELRMKKVEEEKQLRMKKAEEEKQRVKKMEEEKQRVKELEEEKQRMKKIEEEQRKKKMEEALSAAERRKNQLREAQVSEKSECPKKSEAPIAGSTANADSTNDADSDNDSTDDILMKHVQHSEQTQPPPPLPAAESAISQESEDLVREQCQI